MRVQWRRFSVCFCSRPRHCELAAPFLLLISYLCHQAAVALGTHTLSTHTFPLRLECNPTGKFSVHPSHIHFRNQCCCKVLSTVSRASAVAILCDTPVSILLGLSVNSLPPSLSITKPVIQGGNKTGPICVGWSRDMCLWGGALDEKHNLQCPRLQRSSNPGWPVQLGAAVMLVSYKGRGRQRLHLVLCVLKRKCSLCGKENMYVYISWATVCLCFQRRAATINLIILSIYWLVHQTSPNEKAKG